MLDGEERKFLFKQITPSPNQFFPESLKTIFLFETIHSFLKLFENSNDF